MLRSFASSLLPALFLAPGVRAAAANIVPLVPAAVPLAPVEDPALIAIGEQLGPLLERWRRAVAAKAEARALAERLCPRLPDEFVIGGLGPRQVCEQEVDIEDKAVWPPDYVGSDGVTYAQRPRWVFSSRLMKASGRTVYPARSPAGRRFRRLIDRVERHERERRSAIRVSGLHAAIDELHVSRMRIVDSIWKLTKVVPATTEGLKVHAHLLLALEEVGGPHGDTSHLAGAWLGASLARGVLAAN